MVLLFVLFLITQTLKQDDLATAFNTTLLTELEQNYSSGLVENNVFIRGYSKVFLFCLSICSVEKISKKIDRYLGNIEAAIQRYLHQNSRR